MKALFYSKSFLSHMRKISILLCILSVFLLQSLEAQTFEWAHSAETSLIALGTCVATDAHGNVYMTGTFLGKAHFGDIELTGEGRDIFLVKYDTKGKVLWAQRAGSRTDDFAHALAIDKDGNCIVVGSFLGKINFGTDTLVSAGQNDIFIAKYDPKGKLLWAKRAGGNSSDHATTIALDKNGNSYIGGFFKDTMWFSADLSVVSKRASAFNMFIAKYDNKGNPQWAKQIGGSNYFSQDGIAVASEPNGTMYVTGFFQTDAQFDTAKFLNHGTYGLFLAKYEPSGKLVWAKSTSKDGSMITGRAVTADKKGNIFVTGTYTATAVFDTITAASKNLGNADVFLAKYNPAGRIIWLRTTTSFGTKQPYAVEVDAEGSPYIGGMFRDSATFGGSTLTGIGSDIFFLVKYNASGQELWAKQGGRHGTSTIKCVTLDKTGNVFITGNFTDTAEFGKAHIKALANTQDVFIAKLTPQLIIKEKKLADLPERDFQFISCEVSGRSALVKFSIPKPSFISLGFYNEVGDIAESFIEGQRDAGVYEEKLELKNISPGEYYCRLQAGPDKLTKKVIVK
jgi:hypothetical protein